MEHKQTQLANSADKKMFYTEFTIPRKRKTPRRICNPSPKLKQWQRSQLTELNKLFLQKELEFDLEGIFHGFVRQRNCVSGAESLVGTSAIIQMDLSNFFDTVFEKHIPIDLRTMYGQNADNFFHNEGYAYQGAPTSPILANLALLQPLYEIKTTLTALYGKDFKLMQYADDLNCGIYGDKLTYEDEKDIINIITKVMKAHEFEINTNKTRIKRQKFGAMRCLGINIMPTGIQATRRTLKKIRAVRGHMRFSTAKSSVLGGLVTWSQLRHSAGYKQMFSI